MMEGDVRMIPKREQVLARARELFYKQSYRSGMQNVNSPEDSELMEDGFYQQAVSELMRNNPKAETVEWENYNENFGDLRFDLEEAMRSGVLISGTTGTGKSDVGMYLTDELAKHGITIIVFDSSQDWQKRSNVPLYETLTSPHIDTVPESSIVFDISRLAVQERQRLIESFSETLYRHQSMNTSRRQYFLVFEEGSSYFKEGFMRGKRFSNTAMLMSEGRNYGVRFMVITQFFASIDKTAMRYMKQRYFGYTDEKNDVAYVKAFLGEQASKLKDLHAGEFMYYNAGKTTKISIEPYECENTKTQIVIPQSTPAQVEPRAHTHTSALIWAKLAILGLIVLWMIKSL
jgi:hypothetical protein